MKKRKIKQRQSLLSGFGGASLVNDKIEEDDVRNLCLFNSSKIYAIFCFHYISFDVVRLIVIV